MSDWPRRRGAEQIVSMRRAILSVAVLLIATSTGAQVQRVPADVRMPAHPRLLLLRGEEQGILRDIAADSSRRRIHQAIISGADELLLASAGRAHQDRTPPAR